jgi:hypothetical protein
LISASCRRSWRHADAVDITGDSIKELEAIGRGALDADSNVDYVRAY